MTCSPFYPQPTGNVSAKNTQGQFQLDDILTAPTSTYYRDIERNGFKIYSEDGRGAYFRSDGTFRGFIEKLYEQ